MTESSPGESAPAEHPHYHVVCLEREPYHGHITGIGLGGSGGVEARLSTADVWGLIDQGYDFHLLSPQTGAIAHVAKHPCPDCGGYSLRSHRDGAWNDELYALATCPVEHQPAHYRADDQLDETAETAPVDARQGE